MKILFKKMKILTTCSILLISVLVNAQNEFSFAEEIYNGSVKLYDTLDIDLSQAVSDDSLKAGGVNNLIDYKDNPFIYNSSTNKYALFPVWSVTFGWGTTVINKLYIGIYSGSGVSENLQNIFRCYHSENIKARNELILRFRHELNSSYSEGDTVTAIWNVSKSQVFGIYQASSTGNVYIKSKDGQVIWECNLYTCSEATDEEKQEY